MATAVSFKAAVAQRVSTAAPKRATVVKAPVNVEASASRREALRFAALAGTALFAGKASAVQDYQIIDDRDAKKKGFDLIYEARDLEVTQQAKAGESTRFALQRLSPDDTKARVNDSITRIKSSLPTLIEKEYYPVAQRELRSLVGYLRFDLEFLATLTADKKAAAATVNTATTAVEALDFQLRSKSKEGSQAAYAKATAALDAAVKLVA